jgi:hypothetical protein
MFTSTDLKAVITLVRPLIERQLDDATEIAGHREKVTSQGGDWSQVKALVKAMIQDERDESGGHKRVMAILHKADNALGYADMLGLGNLNEKNSFSDDEPDHDPVTGEIIEHASAAADPAGEGGSALTALPADTNSDATTQASDEEGLPALDGGGGSAASAEDHPGGENANSAGNAGTSHASHDAAVEKKPSREAHNLEIAGASPAPATIPEPVPGAAASEGAARGPAPSGVPSNVVPIKKQWKQSDPAHPDCLNPAGCGGFSNLGLCPQCKQAAGMSQVEHRGPINA